MLKKQEKQKKLNVIVYTDNVDKVKVNVINAMKGGLEKDVI